MCKMEGSVHPNYNKKNCISSHTASTVNQLVLVSFVQVLRYLLPSIKMEEKLNCDDHSMEKLHQNVFFVFQEKVSSLLWIVS